MTLDRAYLEHSELRRVLQQLLVAEVRHIVVLEVDLVRDVTVVDVRFRVPGTIRARAAVPRRLEEVAP